MSQADIAARRRARSRGVDVIRVSYPDLIGGTGADVLPRSRERAGPRHRLCRAVYHTTPMGDVVPVAGGTRPAPDIKAVPDLDTSPTSRGTGRPGGAPRRHPGGG